jgi:hypothetical protein
MFMQSPKDREERDPTATRMESEIEYEEGENSDRQQQQQQTNGDDNDNESIQVAEAVLDETMSRKQQTSTSPKSTLSKTRHEIRKYRDLCGKIVNDTRVQLTIVLLIGINGIMLGIATFPFIKGNPDASNAFERCDFAFLVIFTIELGMQFIYNGLHLFLDGWLVFDFIIILTSWAFDQVQIVRAFRIFRAFRLVTRVKTLQNLVTALFSVVPRIAGITLLLALIFFIFSILMTSMWKDLYHEGYTEQDYFSRLDATLFTLFQVLTLDEWAGLTREVMASPGNSWAWFPMIAFVIITAFIVINLIIAVICDAIAALHANEKAMIQGISSADRDADGINDADEEPHVRVKKQLQTLEQQVEELSRMQQQTMHSLQYLTRHLQAKRRTPS